VRGYFFGMAAGALMLPGLLVGAQLFLDQLRPMNMPAPAVSQVEALDVKFRHLRNRPSLAPDVIAVGSSMTWRHFDGKEFEAQSGLTFFNGGTSFLRIHQSRYLADFYSNMYDAEFFVMLTSLPDFEDCTTIPANLFDRRDMQDYVAGTRPEWFYYLKYLALARYVRTGLRLPQRMEPLEGDLWQDEYASGPLHVPEMGLRYGRQDFDPECLEQLYLMSDDLAKAGRRFLVALIPVHPDYMEKYPETEERLNELHDDIQTALQRNGHDVVTLADSGTYSADDFFDAFHLQWPAVQRLSAIVGEQVGIRSFAFAGETTHSTSGTPAHRR
jgi:hypothetical protein